MMFLADKNKPRRTKDNVEGSADQQGQKDSQDEEQNGNEEQNESQACIPSESSLVEQASTPSSSNTPSKVTKTKEFKSPKALKTNTIKRSMAKPGPSTALIFDEAVNLLKSIQSKRSDIKEEHSLYGEQIAIRLRRLPPRTRSFVQQSFNQMLFDAESGINEQPTAPRTPALSNLSSSTSNSPMSFVPRPYQPPTQPVLSPGYSYYSSSTPLSQSPTSVLSDFLSEKDSNSEHSFHDF